MITVMITAAGAGAAGAMWDSIVNKSTLENLSHRHESVQNSTSIVHDSLGPKDIGRNAV